MKWAGKCPSCGELNSSSLDYCAICGIRFTRAQQAPQGRGPSRRKLGKEAKLKLKREKKRGELTELFKRKKITIDQYRKGLNKLGYTTDIDKAEEFKKFIRSQIKDLQEMKVPPQGGPTERYDPYASRAELMRDKSGDVMTDFMVKAAPANRKEMGAIMDAPSMGGHGQGPLFADSLFARGAEPRMPAPGGYAARPMADKPRIGDIVKMPSLERGPPARPPDRRSQRRRLKMVWDEDESVDSSRLRESVRSGEDESESFDEEMELEEDDFEIDLEEEFELEEPEEEDFEIDLDYDESGDSSNLRDSDLEEEEEFVIDEAEDAKVERTKKEVKVWWEDEEDDWWDEEEEGESGWWDDEDWELEDEKEDDEDWEQEGEEEEYGLEEIEEKEIEKKKGVKVSWEEDPDESDDDDDESEDSSYPRRGIRSESVGSDDDFEIEA